MRTKLNNLSEKSTQLLESILFDETPFVMMNEVSQLYKVIYQAALSPDNVVTESIALLNSLQELF